MLPETRMVFNFAAGFKNRFHGDRPGHHQSPGPASVVDAKECVFYLMDPYKIHHTLKMAQHKSAIYKA